MSVTGIPRGCAALLLTAATPLLAQAPQARIDQAAWLTGCWQTSSPQRIVEEQWTVPRGETMLGTGRTVREGRTVEYEFVLLSAKDGHLVYQAHPSGQASAEFLSREVHDGKVVFENLEHDFPQRIGYERQGADGLLAWIEGTQNGRTRRVEFPYRRVACH